MTISGDTDDLVDPTLWGESASIIRNTPTYDDGGAFVDSWSAILTVNIDIQPFSGTNPTIDLGQKRISTHRIFLPNGTAIIQGDRIRPYGWTAGDNSYEVDAVLSDEGHVEVYASLVRGAA
jgi:hypothetical protein